MSETGCAHVFIGACDECGMDAAGYINALTSERDAAVRVAGELRALAADMRAVLDLADGYVSFKEQPPMFWPNWCARYDSLTTTGGSSEPQKGITE